MDLSRLNPFAISGLLIVITHLPLLALTSLKGKTHASAFCTLHTLAVIFWGVGSLAAGYNNTPNTFNLNIWKFSYCSVIFIAVFFYHATHILTKQTSKILLITTYLQGALFAVLAILGTTFSDQRLTCSSLYYPQGGKIFLFSFVSWIAVVSFSHFLIISYYRTTFPEEKKQLGLFVIGAIAGFFGGSTNFIPAITTTFYPYGNFLIPIHSILFTYTILKNQMLDIQIAIKRSLAYSIVITVISIAYLLIIFITEKTLQGFVGYRSVFMSAAIAFFLGILFIPLRNRIQNFFDKIFFHGTHEEIVEENERLKQEVEQTEKLKSISILASGIAHEVKNPLTAIKTFTEYLPQKLNDKEFLQKFSSIVGYEVERIDSLVHELLEFAKPSPLQLKEVDLVNLIDNTLVFLNSKFIKHSIAVDRSYSPSVNICLTADASRLRQALLNIFINAIDAMSKGGRLSVSVDIIDNHVRLSIKDTGAGIDKKYLKNIFDPFYTKKDHGVGLGLSITQRIIHDHGGKIFVKSTLGKGTTLTIELPGAEKV